MGRRTHTNNHTVEIFTHPETHETIRTVVRVRAAAETARLRRLSATLARPKRANTYK